MGLPGRSLSLQSFLVEDCPFAQFLRWKKCAVKTAQ
jgi:hypothetical protein